MRKSPLHECAEDVDWSHALHRESVLHPLSTRGSLSNEVVKERRRRSVLVVPTIASSSSSAELFSISAASSRLTTHRG
jgi:hypothetical protein